MEETEDTPEPEGEDPGTTTQEGEWDPPEPEGEDPGLTTEYANDRDDENRLDL